MSCGLQIPVDVLLSHSLWFRLLLVRRYFILHNLSSRLILLIVNVGVRSHVQCGVPVFRGCERVLYLFRRLLVSSGRVRVHNLCGWLCMPIDKYCGKYLFGQLLLVGRLNILYTVPKWQNVTYRLNSGLFL